jgi:hypothetical protein
MVVSAPSGMVIGEANDRTTEVVPAGLERLALKGALGREARGCVSRVCDRFAVAGIARHEG